MFNSKHVKNCEAIIVNWRKQQLILKNLTIPIIVCSESVKLNHSKAYHNKEFIGISVEIYTDVTCFSRENFIEF